MVVEPIKDRKRINALLTYLKKKMKGIGCWQNFSLIQGLEYQMWLK